MVLKSFLLNLLLDSVVGSRTTCVSGSEDQNMIRYTLLRVCSRPEIDTYVDATTLPRSMSCIQGLRILGSDGKHKRKTKTSSAHLHDEQPCREW